MKTALVTGGASGIGYALSSRLAAEGYRLLWVVKSEEELAQGTARLLTAYPDADVSGLACDLIAPGAAQAILAWSQARAASVDLLVNNAGLGAYGLLSESDSTRDHEVLGVCVLAVYELTRLFLKDMVARNDGTIVNLASVAAILPSPGFAVYSGAKAFVRQFTRCLDYELRAAGSGVRVVCVCPAAVRGTGFQRNAMMTHTRIFDDPTATTPDEVAKDIVAALRAGRREVITGTMLRLLLPLVRLLPNAFLIRRLGKELEREQRARKRKRGQAQL